MQGIQKDTTRSGLYYEGYRILKEKLPKRLKNEFEMILNDIKKLGYNNYWQVLNAKDYRYSSK